MNARRVLWAVTVLGAVLALQCSAAAAASSGGAVFLFGGFGSGQNLLSSTEAAVSARGSATVQFHGDTASGCAALGVCGYSGTIAFRPGSNGFLDVLDTQVGQRHSYLVSLFISDFFSAPGAGRPTVRTQVTWTDPAGGPGSRCADVAGMDGENLTPEVRHGRVSLSPFAENPGALATRCAGPLASDVTGALGTGSVSIRRLLRGRLTIDLTGDSSFAAHGFAGTISSTLVLRVGRGRRTELQSTSVPRKARVTRLRVVDAQYAGQLNGEVDESIRAASETGQCGPLGACGLTGTEALALGTVRARGDFSVEGSARRPTRDLLSSLGLARGGRVAGLTPLGELDWASTAPLSEEVAGAGQSCRDTATVGGGVVILARQAGRLFASYTPGVAGGVGELPRTRCPGTFGPAAFASSGGLATGSVPIGSLVHRKVTIQLRGGASFEDDGWSGVSRPDLKLTLVRRRVTTRIVKSFAVSG